MATSQTLPGNDATQNVNTGYVQYGLVDGASPELYSSLKPGDAGTDPGTVQVCGVTSIGEEDLGFVVTVDCSGGSITLLVSGTIPSVGDVVAVNSSSPLEEFLTNGCYEILDIGVITTGTPDTATVVTDRACPTCVTVPFNPNTAVITRPSGSLNVIAGDFMIRSLCSNPNGVVVNHSPHAYTSFVGLSGNCIDVCTGVVACKNLVDLTPSGSDTSLDSTVTVNLGCIAPTVYTL